MEYEYTINTKEPIYTAFFHYMSSEADNKKIKEKVEGDGRKTQRPQDETKGKWGHHEPVKDKSKDRNKRWKPWQKIRCSHPT